MAAARRYEVSVALGSLVPEGEVVRMLAEKHNVSQKTVRKDIATVRRDLQKRRGRTREELREEQVMMCEALFRKAMHDSELGSAVQAMKHLSRLTGTAVEVGGKGLELTLARLAELAEQLRRERADAIDVPARPAALPEHPAPPAVERTATRPATPAFPKDLPANGAEDPFAPAQRAKPSARANGRAPEPSVGDVVLPPGFLGGGQ